MRKAKWNAGELRPEYKRTDFKKLERGKYHKQMNAGSNIVAVDDALPCVLQVAHRASCPIKAGD